jgi:predicted O-methyltransferase YrrM
VYKAKYDVDVQGLTKQNLAYIINKAGIPNTTIEIGSFYGLTSLYLADNLAPLNKDYQHICIDPYKNKGGEIQEDLEEVYTDFKSNVKLSKYGKHIRLIRDFSFNALIKLSKEECKPQLIYIDGDHVASTVLEDLVLSFNLLVPGGVILCDDSVDWMHKDKDGKADPQMSPRMAVDSFIMCNWNRLYPLKVPHGNQTAFVKR